jgi:hypothetical protein
MPIHAHLALADHPIEAAARKVAQQPVQEVVEPLPGLVLSHLQVPDSLAGLLKLLRGHIDLAVRRCFYKSFESILPGVVRNRTATVGGPQPIPRWRRKLAPHVSWSSTSRPSYWADKIALLASNV